MTHRLVHGIYSCSWLSHVLGQAVPHVWNTFPLGQVGVDEVVVSGIDGAVIGDAVVASECMMSINDNKAQ